jgi:hypothetical protein
MNRNEERLAHLLGVAAALGTAACSVGLSPRVAHTVSSGKGWAGADHTIAAGAEISGSVRLLTDDRVAFGVSEVIQSEFDPAQTQRRYLGLAGYSDLPRNPGRRFGAEGWLSLGAGQIAVEDETPISIIGGLRAGLPVRLTATREPCEEKVIAGLALFMVPELELSGFVPVSGDTRAFQTEAAFLLSFRLHGWTPLFGGL